MPIKKVRIRTEAALLVNPDYRGVRLDVYADDDEESVYDVEMQTTHKRNLPKRSRLYQGQMDMAFLEPGADFNKLPKSFVIFICTYDPFGYGRYRYTYNTRCREIGKELGDETYKIFLNTKGRNAEE
nr:Rpn family recombination-promoting nuclease/putative transposase [Enterocloster clostridioformis]